MYSPGKRSRCTSCRRRLWVLSAAAWPTKWIKCLFAPCSASCTTEYRKLKAPTLPTCLSLSARQCCTSPVERRPWRSEQGSKLKQASYFQSQTKMCRSWSKLLWCQPSWVSQWTSEPSWWTQQRRLSHQRHVPSGFWYRCGWSCAWNCLRNFRQTSSRKSASCRSWSKCGLWRESLW